MREQRPSPPHPQLAPHVMEALYETFTDTMHSVYLELGCPFDSTIRSYSHPHRDYLFLTTLSAEQAARAIREAHNHEDPEYIIHLILQEYADWVHEFHDTDQLYWDTDPNRTYDTWCDV